MGKNLEFQTSNISYDAVSVTSNIIMDQLAASYDDSYENWACWLNINMGFLCKREAHILTNLLHASGHKFPRQTESKSQENLLAFVFQQESRSREREWDREKAAASSSSSPPLLQSFSHVDFKSFSASISPHFSTNILFLTITRPTNIHRQNQTHQGQNPPLTMLLPNFSNTIFILCLFFTLLAATKPLNLTLPHQHPSPDSVALHVIR